MRPKRPLSAARLRLLDEQATTRFGIPSLILMENAALALCELIRCRYPRSKRVLIVCGPGNNGGDGYALARHLMFIGRQVEIVYFKSPSGDAQTNFLIAKRLKIPCKKYAKNGFGRALKRADLLVDALFGIGLNKPLGEPYLSVVRAMNRTGKKIVAVDIPSGLHADTGRSLGEAIRADVTITFVAPKLGFKRARPFTGPVVVRQISAPSSAVRKKGADRPAVV